jgi:hypothetical protein
VNHDNSPKTGNTIEVSTSHWAENNCPFNLVLAPIKQQSHQWPLHALGSAGLDLHVEK